MQFVNCRAQQISSSSMQTQEDREGPAVELVEHTKPCSIVQRLLHPSPRSVFPSSHASSSCFSPSPQMGKQADPSPAYPGRHVQVKDPGTCVQVALMSQTCRTQGLGSTHSEAFFAPGEAVVLPTGQALQIVAPSTSEKNPWGQGGQISCPTRGLKVPARHGEHGDIPANTPKVPLLHGVTAAPSVICWAAARITSSRRASAKSRILFNIP
mmetsp:Transcript_1319/g.2875  ORF Transcript_1319/g.2875 Transcript_1319/m.2875 type:complete len:211 (+) Transcript_1319:803-1435(+)